MTGWLVAPVLLATAMSAGGGAPSELRVGDARVVEGDSGVRSVDLIVTLSQPAPGAVTVDYVARDGTALAGSDYRSAAGTVGFAPGEMTKRITVNVVGDVVVEADETFDVVLGPAAGATIADGTATVTVVTDDFAAGQLSIYEVRLSYAGSSGSMAGAIGCPVRANGRAVLTGLVSGFDVAGAADDAEYTGVLQYDVDLDLCEIDPGPKGDEATLCAVTVVGAGPLSVNLKVTVGDQGGYIKNSTPPGPWMANVFGSCPGIVLNKERAGFPDNSMANIFDGTELPLPSGALQVGQYRDGALLVEVLRVVRRGRLP